MSLVLISAVTRCRCVGIRVEQDGDFPLVRFLGFSEKFVKLERSLLPEDIGAELNDEERLARLECFCGKVIRGEIAGCEALFGREGCLWLNDFSDTERIPPSVASEMRGTCRDEGFQSIALVPCRPDHETLALLHVCDKRPGLLSESLVASLQKTGRHFAKLIFQLRELKRAQSQSREAGAKPASVLVVDDEEEMANLVHDILDAKGHRAVTASGAVEALEIMSEHKVDLVITDYAMPGMSGLELCREIRRRWRPYSPPVILMSGTFSEEMLLREKESPDVAAFLSKPFSVEALMDAIHSAMG